MKRLAFGFLIGMLVLLPACSSFGSESDDQYTIGMMTIASHPSLDAIQQGVKDRLAEAGFIEGENLTILEGNAEGEIATLSTIVQQFIDQDVDLIVATTTPAAQAAYNATKDVGGPPIIFNGVSNPFVAGLAESADVHPAWIVGNQLLDPVGEALELAARLVPDLEVAGIIYNPAEANSEYLVGIAQGIAEEMGISLEVAPISNSSEIQTAAESLLNRGVGAYIAISDNTLTSGFEALVQTANENDIPIIGTSASMPGLGAIASYGINPYQEGLDSGDLVVLYLQGDLDISTKPIEIQDAVLLTVNPEAAEEQAVRIPDSVLESADKVIGQD